MKRETEIMCMLEEARFLKNNLGQPKKAINLCNEILDMDSSCRDAMLIKAGAMNETFLLDEAEKLIRHIVEKWPAHWEGYYLLALNCLSREEDEEGLKAIDKSVELDENFDNLITKAQMLYLLGTGDYKEYVEKARKIDKQRTENFMKTHFTYDVNAVKPTLSEWFNAIKHIFRKKK